MTNKLWISVPEKATVKSTQAMPRQKTAEEVYNRVRERGETKKESGIGNQYTSIISPGL